MSKQNKMVKLDAEVGSESMSAVREVEMLSKAHSAGRVGTNWESGAKYEGIVVDLGDEVAARTVVEHEVEERHKAALVRL